MRHGEGEKNKNVLPGCHCSRFTVDDKLNRWLQVEQVPSKAFTVQCESSRLGCGSCRSRCMLIRVGKQQ